MLLHPGIDLDPAVADEIAAELNVHALEQVDTVSDLLSWTVVANFAALGPRLGKRVNEVAGALRDADGDALHDELERTGRIVIEGETLTADDVELRATRHESFALSEDAGWAVALDLTMDDELRAEGLARELSRALNEERKRLGFAISDRVAIRLWLDDDTAKRLAPYFDWIAGETLATGITVVDGTPRGHTVDLDAATATIALDVVAP